MSLATCFARPTRRGSRFNAVVLLWSVKQWFYSSNFLPRSLFLFFPFFLFQVFFPSLRISRAVFRCASASTRFARRTRNGAILAFHTEKDPHARSTYRFFCVKRTSKQNLRLFRKNKNAQTRDAETAAARSPKLRTILPRLSCPWILQFSGVYVVPFLSEKFCPCKWKWSSPRFFENDHTWDIAFLILIPLFNFTLN